MPGGRLAPVIGDGQAPAWPLHVADLARAVVECVEREELAGSALEVGGPERLTMDDVVWTLARVLGKRRLTLHHPVGLMKLVAWPIQFLPDAFLSPGAVDFVTQVVEMDPRPAAELLGVGFRRLEDGLREYVS
jgi:nucleoside-diphosphate-sugar epimerase